MLVRAPRMVLPTRRDDCFPLDGAGTRTEPGPQTGVEVGGGQVLEHPADGRLRGQGLARLKSQGLQVRWRSGRWCAPVSPSGCDSRRALRSRPGPGPRTGCGARPAGPGAGATRRSWWGMTSARAPRTKGLIRHHSSSPRGPRPRINDTPSPVKTAQTPSPTDFADPLTQDRRASGWTPISSVILRIAPLARAGSASASKVILVARSRSSSGYFLESHGSDPYLASLPPQTPGRFKA